MSRIVSRPEAPAYCVFAFFFPPNTALMLSSNSIFAPCLRMMIDCCATDSVLFHAQ